MTQNGQPSTIERATDLARSGTCTTIPEVRQVLVRERHEGAPQHLEGAALRRQLTRLIAERQVRNGVITSNQERRSAAPKWRLDEDQQLRSFRAAGADETATAAVLGRTLRAVQTRMSFLHVRRPK